MNRLALVVSLLALSAGAAPAVLEAGVGLDSQPKTLGGQLRWYAVGVELGFHLPVTGRLSLGLDASWARHTAYPSLSDCIDCRYPQQADTYRGGPSVRWSWALERLQVYLQVGPQVTLAVVHESNGFGPGEVNDLFGGFAVAGRAGALVELTRWLAVGAAIDGWVGTADVGGIGGTGSMVIALRL